MGSDTAAASIAVVTLIIQAALIGVQFTTFLLSLRLHISSDNGYMTRKNIQWPMLIVSAFLVTFSAIHLGLGLRSILLALKGNDSLMPMDIIATANVIGPSARMEIDGILVYRCWVIYNRRWPIIVLPALLLLYNFSNMIVVTYWITSGGAKVQVVPFTLISRGHRIDRMHEGFSFATIIISIYVTSAIIIKICRNNAPGSRLQPDFSFAIRVITESGLAYTLATITLLCAIFIRDSPNGSPYPLIIMCSTLIPISGISYDVDHHDSAPSICSVLPN